MSKPASELLAPRLRDIPIFSPLEEAERLDLARRTTFRRYAARQALFMQGDPGDELFLLLAGAVRVAAPGPGNREVTLAILTEGAFFGDMALLDGKPRSTSVFAVRECEVGVLGREDFLEFLDFHPPVARRLLAFLSQRLRRADGQICDMSTMTVRQRLARTLRDLALGTGEVGSHGVLLPREITHRVLAEMLNTSRETVTREAAALRHRRLVDQEGHRIRVLDPDGLEEVVRSAH